MTFIAKRKICLVSHHPYEHSKSPCVSVYNLFVQAQAPYRLHGFLDVRASPDKFEKDVDALHDRDIVYLFNSATSLLNANAISLLQRALLEGNQIVVYWHESAWNLRFFQRRDHRFFSQAIQLLQSPLVTHWVPSVAIKQIILYLFGCSRARVSTVFETIRIDDSSMIDRTVSKSSLLFFGAGLPDERKGADIFVDLSDRLQEHEFRWYAARESKSHFGRRTQSSRVRWMGHSNAFTAELHQADVFLLTSRDDPSPIVGLEALALDIPVFAFDTTGYVDVLPSEFVSASISGMEHQVRRYLENCALYPAGFFRRIAERFVPETFEERYRAGTCSDEHQFPDAPEIGDLASRLSSTISQLARERSASRRGINDLVEENKALIQEVKGKNAEIKSLQNTISEAKLSLPSVLKPYGSVAEIQTKILEVTQELAELRTAHRLARIEVKDSLRGYRKDRILDPKKKIIVVGNSPVVLETEHGAIIDEFDVVIRINNFKTVGYEKHVGSRVSHLFISPACAPNSEFDRVKPEDVFLYGADRSTDTEYLRERLASEDPKRPGCMLPFSKINRLSPTLYFYGLKFLTGMETRQWPSTGLVAIQWAIDMFARDAEVFYHGFSFFAEDSVNLNHYFDFVTPADGHHDFAKERTYVKRLERGGKLQALTSLSPGALALFTSGSSTVNGVKKNAVSGESNRLDNLLSDIRSKHDIERSEREIEQVVQDSASAFGWKDDDEVRLFLSIFDLVLQKKYQDAKMELRGQKPSEALHSKITDAMNWLILPKRKMEWTAHGVRRSFRFWKDEEKVRYLKFVQDVITDLRPLSEMVALGFGSVLSFVREGDLLEHDDDLDIIIAFDRSQANTIRDGLRVVSEYLVPLGYECSGKFFSHWHVKKGGLRVDVFVGIVDEGDRIGWFPAPRGNLHVSDIFPASMGRLYGVDCDLPREPEIYLEKVYGKNWRCPEPYFKHKRDRSEYSDVR